MTYATRSALVKATNEPTPKTPFAYYPRHTINQLVKTPAYKMNPGMEEAAQAWREAEATTEALAELNTYLGNRGTMEICNLLHFVPLTDGDVVVMEGVGLTARMREEFFQLYPSAMPFKPSLLPEEVQDKVRACLGKKGKKGIKLAAFFDEIIRRDFSMSIYHGWLHLEPFYDFDIEAAKIWSKVGKSNKAKPKAIAA